MKKILWLLILIITVYILLVFKAPTLANDIEKLIWLNWLNQKIINIKNKLNMFWTKVPTKQDLSKYYSWTVNTIKKTKESIDELRLKADELKNKYKTAQDWINKVQNKLENIKKTVDKISNVWSTINKIITTTWTVN